MSSRPPHKYDAAVKALLRLRSDFAVLADDPKMVEEWVDEFSTRLETVFASGAHLSVDAGEDVQVAAFLRDVRARLLPHATEAWLEHSPRVVAGMEEELRRRAAAPSAVPVLDPIVAPAAPRPSPVPLQDDFALLLEYSQRVKAGMMSEAEFEAHKCPRSSVSPAVSVAPPPLSLAPSPSALGAIAASFPAVSPSLSVVPPPSSQAPSPFQPPAPSPAALGTSTPSPLLFSTVAPSLPGPSGSATVPALSQRPVHRATAVAAASLVESPPARRFGVKRARSAELMDTSSIPGYVRCDYCTCNKVRCAPHIGSQPPYACSRCLEDRRPCIAPTALPARRRRKIASSARVSAASAPLLTPVPPSAHATDAAFTLLAGGVVDRAAALLFWRAKLGRALSAHVAADGYVKFVQARYTDLLGEVVAPPPGPSASRPAPKRARTSAARKGKGAVNGIATIVGLCRSSAGPQGSALIWHYLRILCSAEVVESARLWHGRELALRLRVSSPLKNLAALSQSAAQFILSRNALSARTAVDQKASGKLGSPGCSSPAAQRDVAQFLRDFYSSWHNVERLAEFAEADGIDESTRALRT
ncbi:hypothetical protein BJY52DRAFT_1227243, partial [Lactarius psammicola]